MIRPAQWFALLAGFFAPLVGLAADPVATTAEQQSALVEYRARHDAVAKAALEKLLTANPQDDFAHFYLGKLAKRRKDWKEAIAHWKRCTELKPEFAEYWGVLSEAYGKRIEQNFFTAPRYGRPALTALETAIARDPDDLRFRAGYIKAMLELPGILGGSVRKAREQAEEMKQRDAFAGRLALGHIELHEKNWDAAEQAFLAAVALKPESPEPAIELARLLIERGRSADALKRCDELLAQNPNHPGAQVYFAQATLACDRDLERGEAALQKFLVLPSPPAQLPSAPEAQAMLGEFRARRGDKDGARAAFEAALAMDPDQKLARAGMKRLRSAE